VGVADVGVRRREGSAELYNRLVTVRTSPPLVAAADVGVHTISVSVAISHTGTLWFVLLAHSLKQSVQWIALAHTQNRASLVDVASGNADSYVAQSPSPSQVADADVAVDAVSMISAVAWTAVRQVLHTSVDEEAKSLGTLTLLWGKAVAVRSAGGSIACIDPEALERVLVAR